MIAPIIAIITILLFTITDGWSMGLLFVAAMVHEIREGLKEGRSRQDR